MSLKHTGYTFNVVFSEEDDEWVATVDEMPSLSFLSKNPVVALAGLVEIIEDTEGELDGDLGGEA